MFVIVTRLISATTCTSSGFWQTGFFFFLMFGGKKYTPKVFSALKTRVPQQAKTSLVYTKKLVFNGKNGTEKENTYTPKRLSGICGGPLRAVLVYRFWAPICARHPRKGGSGDVLVRPDLSEGVADVQRCERLLGSGARGERR